MDSLRVVINNVEVGYYSARAMGFNVTWSTKLIDDINSFRTVTTKTIKLPLVKEVQNALKYPSELDQVESSSQKRKDSIDIYVNESVPVKGWIKASKTVIGEFEEYFELTIAAKEKQWIDLFKDLIMTEIELSDQDHTLVPATIRGSEIYSSSVMYAYAPIDIGEITRLPVLWVKQNGTITDFYYIGERQSTGGLFTGTTYGFENSALHLNFQQFADVPDLIWNPLNIFIARIIGLAPTKYYDQFGYLYTNEASWQVNDLYPSIRIKDLVVRAFAEIGYKATVEGNFMDNDFHFQHDIDVLNKFEEPRNKFKVKVFDGGFEFTETSPGTSIITALQTFIMPFVNTGLVGYKDNSNYIDTNSETKAFVNAGTNLSKYVFPETGILRVKWDYDFTISAPSLGFLFAIDLIFEHRNSSGTLLRSVTAVRLPNSSISLTAVGIILNGTIESSYFYGNANDFIQCKATVWYIGGPTLSSINVRIGDGNTLESFFYKGGHFRGKSIRLNEYLPEVSAYKWIKDIAFINNLQFYTNDALKTVYIVRDEEKRTGKKISHLEINRKRDVEIEEIGKLHPYKYIFNWLKDDNDKLVDEIEAILGERFAKGEIVNNNQFNIDEKTISLEVYAPSHNKNIGSSKIRFACAEMRGVDKYDQMPKYERVNYKPRYLRIQFDEALTDHSLPVDGELSSPVYSIEGDTSATSYLYATMPEDLWFENLLLTAYKQTIRRIFYGWILRAYFFINENDVDGFANILDSGNDFRADFWLRLKSVEIMSELLRVNDYSPANPTETQMEFVFFRDNI